MKFKVEQGRLYWNVVNENGKVVARKVLREEAEDVARQAELLSGEPEDQK